MDLRDVLWEDIFKLSASAAASEFCEWVQVAIDVYNLQCPPSAGGIWKIFNPIKRGGLALFKFLGGYFVQNFPQYPQIFEKFCNFLQISPLNF